MLKPAPVPPPPRPIPRRRTLRSSTRAFTIVEVMMATFIMAFGIATSIIAMQSGFKTLDVARSTTLSSQILQSEMERLRLMSWSEIDALSGTSNVALNTVITTDVSITSKFSLTRTVSDVTGKVGEMKEISLTVSFDTIDGRTLSRSFRTYYTNNGLYDYFYTVARS